MSDGRGTGRPISRNFRSPPRRRWRKYPGSMVSPRLLLTLLAAAPQAQEPPQSQPFDQDAIEASQLEGLLSQIRGGRPRVGTGEAVTAEESAYYLASRERLREFAKAHVGRVAGARARVLSATLSLAGMAPAEAKAELLEILGELRGSTAPWAPLLRMEAHQWLVEADPAAAIDALTPMAQGDSDEAKAAQVLIDVAKGRQRLQVGAPWEVPSASAVDGRIVNEEMFRGKVVLVHYWSTGSAASIQDIEKLKPLYKELRDKGFEILGVSLDGKRIRSVPGGGEPLGDGAAALRTFTEKLQMPWPVLYDGLAFESPRGKQYLVTTVPGRILVGRDGKLLATSLDPQKFVSQIREAVEKK